MKRSYWQRFKDFVFARRTFEQIIADDIGETQSYILEFEKALEHDRYMLGMYRARLERLHKRAEGIYQEGVKP